MIDVGRIRESGHSVTRRDWIGVGLTAFGLAFLAATLGETADSAHSQYGGVALLGVGVTLWIAKT